MTGTTALLEDIKRDRSITEPKRHHGGPQSGLPPDFIVGSELAPHLIVGIDFGLTGIRVSTYMNQAPVALYPREFASGISFDRYGEPRPAAANEARLLPRKTLGSASPLLIDGRYFWSEELCTVVLKDMKQRIEQSYSRLLAKAVITVPSSFTHLQRSGLLVAAKNADIQVLSLLNQPTAAGLSCAYWNSLPSGNYLSVSIGETSCECSVIDLQSTLVEVKTVKSDPRLCGEGLFKIIAAAFLAYGMEITEKPCSFTERELLRNVRVFINELGDEEEVKARFSDRQYLRITRNDVLGWLESTLQEYVALFDETIRQAGIVKNNLRGVIISGGISKLWLVDGVIRFFAKETELLQAQVDDYVKSGAALYAALLVRQEKDWVVWDTLGQRISVASGEVLKHVIAPNSPMPITGHVTLAPNEAGAVSAQIVQSDYTSPSQGIICANVEIKDVPPSTEDPTCVDLAVHIKADGTLDMSARHKFLDVHLPIKVTPPAVSVDLEYDIGVAIDRTHAGVFYVSSVEPFSDAEAAGIQMHDVVIAKNNLRIDPLAEAIENPLQGKQGEIINLTLARGKQRISASLECKLSRNSWDQSKFESSILDSVYTDNVSVMITRLFQYGELCAFRSRLPEFALAERNFAKALSVAREKLSKDDPLLIEAMCNMCRFEILRYDREMKVGQEACAQIPKHVIDVLCVEILKLTTKKRSHTKKTAHELRKTAGMMLRSHVGVELKKHTISLYGRAVKMANATKVPKEISELYKEEYKHAVHLLFQKPPAVKKDNQTQKRWWSAAHVETKTKEDTETQSKTCRKTRIKEAGNYEVGVSLQRLLGRSEWMVTGVDPMLLASKPDVHAFDFLFAINGQRLTSESDIRGLLRGQAGEIKRLQLRRNAQVVEVDLECTIPVSPWEREQQITRTLNETTVTDGHTRVALFLARANLRAMDRSNFTSAFSDYGKAEALGAKLLEPTDPLRIMVLAKLCQFKVAWLDDTLTADSDSFVEITECRKELTSVARQARATPELASLLFETAEAIQSSPHWKMLRWHSLHFYTLTLAVLRFIPHPVEFAEACQAAYANACRRN